MSFDAERVRQAKLFRDLSDEAFATIFEESTLRGFSSGEAAIALKDSGEFSDCFGYLIAGQVLFLAESSNVLGFAKKNEFFVSRPFTLSDLEVVKVVSSDDATMVLYIPKQVLSQVSETFPQISDRLLKGYDIVLERSKIIAEDAKQRKRPRQWASGKSPAAAFNEWVESIERERKKRAEAQKSTTPDRWGHLVKLFRSRFRR